MSSNISIMNLLGWYCFLIFSISRNSINCKRVEVLSRRDHAISLTGLTPLMIGPFGVREEKIRLESIKVKVNINRLPISNFDPRNRLKLNQFFFPALTNPTIIKTLNLMSQLLPFLENHFPALHPIKQLFFLQSSVDIRRFLCYMAIRVHLAFISYKMNK